MISMPRTYGVSLCWISERIQQGLLKLIDERTSHMVADVFTKIVKPTVLFDARIMIEYKEKKEAEANSSQRMIHAVLDSESRIKTDYRQLEDGSVEIKLNIPSGVLMDPRVLKAFTESFGLSGAVGQIA